MEPVFTHYLPFLLNLHNSEYVWRFELYGGVMVTGRVLNALTSSDGRLLSFQVDPIEEDQAPFEVPWCSVVRVWRND